MSRISVADYTAFLKGQCVAESRVAKKRFAKHFHEQSRSFEAWPSLSVNWSRFSFPFAWGELKISRYDDRAGILRAEGKRKFLYKFLVTEFTMENVREGKGIQNFPRCEAPASPLCLSKWNKVSKYEHHTFLMLYIQKSRF